MLGAADKGRVATYLRVVQQCAMYHYFYGPCCGVWAPFSASYSVFRILSTARTDFIFGVVLRCVVLRCVSLRYVALGCVTLRFQRVLTCVRTYCEDLLMHRI